MTKNSLMECQLCNSPLRLNFSNFCEHIQMFHPDEIIKRFRYFPLTQLTESIRPETCCICGSSDNSPGVDKPYASFLIYDWFNHLLN